MEAEHFQRVFALGRKGRQVLGGSLDEGYYGIGLQRRIEPELLHKCFSYEAIKENRTEVRASVFRIADGISLDGSILSNKAKIYP